MAPPERLETSPKMDDYSLFVRSWFFDTLKLFSSHREISLWDRTWNTITSSPKMGARTQLHRIAIVPWIEVNEDCGVTFDARTVYASFVPESGRSVLSPQINFMNSGRYLSSHTIENNYGGTRT